MMETAVVARLLNLTPQMSSYFFLVMAVGGSLVILSSFYLIDVKALLYDEFLTVKERVVGIVLFIVFAHLTLTYLAKRVFNKLQAARILIQEKNDAFVKIDKAKTEFVSMATHELKTPVVPILSYAKMLLQERFVGLTDSQKEKLNG